MIERWFEGTRWGREWILVGAMALIVATLSACSEGESDLLNPRGPRGGIATLPETTRVSTSDRDRSFRPRVATGGASVLFLSREGEVQSEAYFRFDLAALPDTSGVERANLGLRFRRTDSGPVVIEAFEVSPSAEDWDESTLREALPRVEPAFFSSTLPIAPGAGDTLYVSNAVTIPGSLIRAWKLDPDHNRGLVVRIAEASAGRSIEVLSKEAALTDTAGYALVNPRLEVLRGEDQTSAIESPDDDTYFLTDGRTAAAGDAVELRVSGRPAERGLLRFSLPEVLRRGFTVNRALLRLRMVPGSVVPGDSLLVGAYLSTTDWTEATEPDSVNRGSTAFDFARARANSDTLEFDCALAVQHWIDSGENYGLQLRSATEGGDTLAVRVYTREAESTLRPSLEIVFTRPPAPRWEDEVTR